MKRRIAYAAAVAVALFATGAGLFLLLNGPGRAFLRRQVELQLADLLEGEVRIGEVELILARGLGLRGRDVRVYPYGEGYGMRADVVEVELREWGLATADLELALLEIEGFAMRATLDEKGTWSFPPLRALQAEEEPEEAEEEWQEPVLAVVHGFERVSRYLLEDERIADVIVITDAHVEFIDRSLDARMREGMALQRFQLSEASARLDRPWLRGGGSLGIAGVVVGPAGRTVPVTHSAHVDANGIHGSFQIGELDLDVLDGYVQSAWARNADLDGTVRAEVKLDSPREGYVVVRLEAELENFIPTIVVADDPVPLELPIDQASATLEVEPGVARILESRVRGPRLAAGVTGRIERPIAASSLAHLDLRIEGADLDDVTPLVRQLPRRTVEAIVEWFDRLESGTCEKLRVSGTTELAEWGELAGGELRRLPRNFVMSLRVADVTARLEDGDAIEGGAFEVDWTADRMQLRRGSGIWRGEPLAEIDLTVDGFSKFVGLTEPTRRVAAEPTPGARLLWDILVPDDPDPEATPIRFEVEIDYLEHPILRWAIEDASVVVTPTVTGSDAQVLGASWGGQPVVAEILYQVEPPRLVVGLEAVDEVPKPVDFLAEGTSQGEGEWGRGRFRLEPYEPREGEEPDMLSNMAGEFVLVGSQLRVEPFELQLSSKVTANARIALELGSKVEVGVDLEGQFSDTSCDGPGPARGSATRLRHRRDGRLPRRGRRHPARRAAARRPPRNPGGLGRRRRDPPEAPARGKPRGRDRWLQSVREARGRRVREPRGRPRNPRRPADRATHRGRRTRPRVRDRDRGPARRDPAHRRGGRRLSRPEGSRVPGPRPAGELGGAGQRPRLRRGLLPRERRRGRPGGSLHAHEDHPRGNARPALRAHRRDRVDLHARPAPAEGRGRDPRSQQQVRRGRARHGGPVKGDRARDKVVDRETAARWARAAHRRGERVVFTNGCFDLLHVGHVRSLEQARSLGDRLVVAVNGDASVRRLKGEDRPVVPARQRMEVLAALACVDRVFPFHAATPLGAILAVRPDVLAKGGDWALDEIVGRAEVESWGGRVVRLREVPGVRTTRILDRLR